jgi:hypothetical protein
MAQVFISYASVDRERIEPLVKALTAGGHQVWWDRDVAQGQNFGVVIQEALDRAGCVIVVWTEAAVASEWVVNEASTARKRGVLVPVLLDPVEVPLEFRHLQLGSLIGWDGDADAPQFKEMLASVLRHMEPTAAATDSSNRRPIQGVARPSRKLPTAWAGKTAALALLLLSAGVLLIGLKQIGLFGGAQQDRGHADDTPSRGAQDVSQPAAAAGSKLAQAAAADDANLLSPESGGRLLQANQEEWRNLVEPKLRTNGINAEGFAVFGFRDDKPARFDTLAVYVESTDSYNAKQIALSTSDDSPNGPFHKLAEITLPNARNMQQPYHEFAVGPATSRYVKLQLISWQSGSDMPNGYLGNIQLLNRHR